MQQRRVPTRSTCSAAGARPPDTASRRARQAPFPSPSPICLLTPSGHRGACSARRPWRHSRCYPIAHFLRQRSICCWRTRARRCRSGRRARRDAVGAERDVGRLEPPAERLPALRLEKADGAPREPLLRGDLRTLVGGLLNTNPVTVSNRRLRFSHPQTTVCSRRIGPAPRGSRRASSLRATLCADWRGFFGLSIRCDHRLIGVRACDAG